MKSKSAQKVKLTSYDDLFGTSEQESGPAVFRRKGGFMLTLWEIKQNVKNPDKDRKVPTAKHLQNTEMMVVSRCIGKDAEVTVYQCGYAMYRIGKYATVFPVHACGDYLYLSCGKILCIREQFFNCQEWYVRLVLEGEDRVSRNRESQEQEKSISYSAVSEEWGLVADMEQSPLEQIIVKESVGEMLELLTKKQRLIISQFFFCRKTQKEIAKEIAPTQKTIGCIKKMKTSGGCSRPSNYSKRYICLKIFQSTLQRYQSYVATLGYVKACR